MVNGGHLCEHIESGVLFVSAQAAVQHAFDTNTAGIRFQKETEIRGGYLDRLRKLYFVLWYFARNESNE